MSSKFCKKCGEEKDIAEFSKCSNSKDKLRPECKKCVKNYNKVYYENNSNNIKIQVVAYKNANPGREIERQKLYNSLNKEKRNALHSLRFQSDALYKLNHNLHSLISHAFWKNKYTENSKLNKILGCDYNFLLLYLGEKEKDTDTLDHICPCSQAQNEDEILKLQHYSNLRWLDRRENKIKANKKTLLAESKCKSILKRECI